jgi:hypothetical protein
MIHLVVPLGGTPIGKAASSEEAWWLCYRYGLEPLAIGQNDTVAMVEMENGDKAWTVRCKHVKFPFNPGAFENRRRDGLAQLDNGLPAWPVAEESGTAFRTF